MGAQGSPGRPPRDEAPLGLGGIKPGLGLGLGQGGPPMAQFANPSGSGAPISAFAPPGQLQRPGGLMTTPEPWEVGGVGPMPAVNPYRPAGVGGGPSGMPSGMPLGNLPERIVAPPGMSGFARQFGGRTPEPEGARRAAQEALRTSKDTQRTADLARRRTAFNERDATRNAQGR